MQLASRESIEHEISIDAIIVAAEGHRRKEKKGETRRKKGRESAICPMGSWVGG